MEEPNDIERSIAETNRNLMKEVTAEKISLSRASSYGSAGSALAIVLVLLQKESLDGPLLLSLYTAIFSLPVFVALAMAIEAFLWFGEKTFPYFREAHHTQRYFLLMVTGYGALLVSFLAIVAHFSYLAAAGLVVLIWKLLVEYNRFHDKLTELTDESEENPNNYVKFTPPLQGCAGRRLRRRPLPWALDAHEPASQNLPYRYENSS
ncbi:hypothetical protein [Nitrosomonas sp.]|uniref:hypothetical protein n=1 Tax=Nitrosomonas sp. TaxID=42353 RepID=UPI0020841325|nr:hypothetical protein [Nitrosomonas sp.]GJL75174.1 MAG: hypothetical protein NMNS02_12800 [Nitrosomonas sp.]